MIKGVNRELLLCVHADIGIKANKIKLICDYWIYCMECVLIMRNILTNKPKFPIYNKLVYPTARLDPLARIRVEIHIPYCLREAKYARIRVDHVHENGVTLG